MSDNSVKNISTSVSDILKDKFKSEELSKTMGEYELLRLLLDYTSIKDNAYETIVELYNRFGSLKALANAKKSDFANFKYMSEDVSALFMLIGYFISINSSQNGSDKFFEKLLKPYKETVRIGTFESLWISLYDDDYNAIAVEKFYVSRPERLHADFAPVIEYATYYKAKKLCIAHSHMGSNNTELSEYDKWLVEDIVEPLKRIDIEVLGQIIICKNQINLYMLDKNKYKSVYKSYFITK